MRVKTKKKTWQGTVEVMKGARSNILEKILTKKNDRREKWERYRIAHAKAEEASLELTELAMLLTRIGEKK